MVNLLFRIALCIALFFPIAANASSFQTLLSFKGSIGGGLGLTIDGQGSLYGMSAAGGADGTGVVYEFYPSSRKLTTLYSFSGGSDGDMPVGELVLVLQLHFMVRRDSILLVGFTGGVDVCRAMVWVAS
jgi:uncharacterized repeat protein (TIGR03803 family)